MKQFARDDVASAGESLKSLIDRGAFARAREIVRNRLRQSPDNPALLLAKARIHRETFQPVALLTTMHRAWQLGQERPELCFRYALDLASLSKIDESEAILDRLPTNFQAQSNVTLLRALLSYQRRDYHIAQSVLESLLETDPDYAPAELELAQLLLIQGDWERGWDLYESRFRQHGVDNYAEKVRSRTWRGEAVDGRIVLIADQGYGDCFQFARYIPAVAERVGEVVLMRSLPLAKLLDKIDGISDGYHRWQDLPAHRMHCTLSSLPMIFGTTSDTVPQCHALLSTPPQVLKEWAELSGRAAHRARLKVGIAFCGRLNFRDNYLRSIPAEQLVPLISVPDCAFVSLQVGSMAASAEAIGLQQLLPDEPAFDDTAALMCTLDLVITTDTSVAHLAATLGCETWLMLSYSPDWRWGYDQVASPWYPKARLYRQPSPGNWSAVVEQVRLALVDKVTTVDV